MNTKLFFQAFGKFFFGLLLVGLLLFVPAGTINYPNAWLLIGILFVPMLVAGIVMMFRDPELLKKRLNAKEKEKGQKAVLVLSGLMFLAAFIVAGLNFRFQWIVIPSWLVYTSAAVFLAAYLMYAEVLRENAYLSRTIEVQDNQKVIDTGLYGVIRHPMYCATLFLFLSMGIVLGSPISFVILLAYIPIITLRISNEEKVLKRDLPGYEEYCERVKYRVVPLIW